MSDYSTSPTTPPPGDNRYPQPVDVSSASLGDSQTIYRSTNAPAPADSSQPPDPSSCPPTPHPTPLKPGVSSLNRCSFTPLTDKKLGMGLVDANGLGPRFIELTIEQFDELIPGARPTDDQREHFYAPMLKKMEPPSGDEGTSGQETPQVKGEFALYPQVTQAVQSVLNAAGEVGTKLRYLETPRHKAADGTNKRKNTVNDGGIYLNTKLARAATAISQGRRGKTKQAVEQSEHRGRRSWDYLVVPFEIKYDPQQSAFYNTPTPKQDSPSSSKESEKGLENVERASNEPTASSSSHATPEAQSAPRGRSKRGSADRGRGRGRGRGKGKGKTNGKGKGKAKAKRTASPSPSMHMPDTSTPEGDSVGSKQPTTTPPVGPRPRPKVDTFIRNSQPGEQALAQFAEYMFNVFKHQHRVSCWGVYVTYDQTRLLYFDRAGAFVSQSFDWTRTDSLLHTFIWKLAHMSDVNRGYDPTATQPSPEELQRLSRAKNDNNLHPTVRQFIEEEMGNGYPLYRVSVTSYSTRAEDAFPDETSAADLPPYPQPRSSSTGKPTADEKSTWTRRYFIVGRPHFTADSLIGRCTRGYVAFDLTDNAFYYLKDLWRSWAPGKIRPEHLVYERLHRHNVPGIAPLICGGDVGGPLRQTTGVQDSFTGETRPVMRVHYRIVTGKIGLSLMSFENFDELAIILRGAITTHFRAWDHAKVLHRDISVSNILIDPETRRAILIDWDLSRVESELRRPAAEPDRTGTWQFRSGLSLRYPYKPYRVGDDVESFVHIFHYLVLRFHATKVEDLYNEVTSRFQQTKTINNIQVGGMKKILDFSVPKAPFQVARNAALQMVLDRLAMECYRLYSTVDHKYMGEHYGVPDPDDTGYVGLWKKHDRYDVGDDDLPADEPFVISGASSNLAVQDSFNVETSMIKHGTLTKILQLYHFEADDKLDDQFVEKADQDAETAGKKTRHIAYLSRTCTSHFGPDYQTGLLDDGPHHHGVDCGSSDDSDSSEEVPSSPARQSSPNYTMSVGPYIDSSLVGGTRTSQKRGWEENSGQGYNDDHEGRNPDARPVKRRNTRSSGAASKMHS